MAIRLPSRWRSLEGGEFRGRIEAVTQPFRFSVAAGDDATSIYGVAVQVVPPPALKSLVIRLIAPAYTGLPAQVLAPGLAQIRALEGTKIELEAAANKPLVKAELRVGEGRSPQEPVFDSSRMAFKTELAVKGSFSFWFDLKDTDGFKNRDAVHYEVRGFRDEAPRVVIDEPKTDRDVPADAVVPVRVTVDDDFGLQSARLIYRVATGESEPHDEVAIPLWTAPLKGRDGQAPPVKHHELAHDWPMASLKLQVGAIVTFYADAHDFDTIKGPNVGKSREVRLRIVSKEDAIRQFDDSRRDLREDLARLLTMQKQALAPVENAARNLEQTKQLDPRERDDLNNAGMIQRQVGNRVNNRDDGVTAKVRRMLDELRNDKLDIPDAQKQLEEMMRQLGVIRDQHLGPAEQAISRATKSLDQNPASPAAARQSTAASDTAAPSKPTDQPPPSPAEPAAKERTAGAERKEAKKPEEQPAPAGKKSDSTELALAEAKTNQKAIATELEKMLESLSEFETYRGVVKDAQELVKQHEQTMKQTAEVADKPDMAGKRLDALSPEQKSELGNLAARQAQVGKGLQNLLERMGEMAKRLDASDPLASSALREAAEKSQRQGTAAKLNDAADRLEKNQMGEARPRQDQARDELKDLVDAIQNRRERELARLVKELKNAEAELEKTRARQAQNLKKTRDAQNNPNAQQRREQLKRLAKEQAEIKKDLERQLQRLAKLSADRAARAGQTAAGRMSRAQNQLDDDQGEDAGKQEEEALSDLEDAQDELEEVRKDAEEQLAVEQLARMGDRLKSLAERQEKIVTETVSYEAAAPERKRQAHHRAAGWGQGALGHVQSGIKDETGELIENLDGAPVFALTLRRAGENMDDRGQATRGAQNRSRYAGRRPRGVRSLQETARVAAGRRGRRRWWRGRRWRRWWRRRCRQRRRHPGRSLSSRCSSRSSKKSTNGPRAWVSSSGATRQLTPEQTAELKRLSEEQGVLADLVRDLTRPKRADEEE